MVVFLKLDLKTPQLQVCLDARLDFLELEGLGHKVRRPDAKAFDLVQGFLECADEDDGIPSASIPFRRSQTRTIHAGMEIQRTGSRVIGAAWAIFRS
jgi:hypothetical protein